MKPQWALAGLLLGALPALVWNLPAAWLAAGVHSASAGRLLLADAAGTVWSGSAVLALTDGAPQRSALALPGRLSWRLGWHEGQPTAWLQQTCCTPAPLVLRWQPGLQHQRFTLNTEHTHGAAATAPNPSVWGQWPMGLLAGLGAPWNTMRLSGNLQLAAAQPLLLTLQQGRLQLQGELDLNLHQVASRISPLHTLGEYSLQVSAPLGTHTPQVLLQTLKGPLMLQATGHWDPQGLHLRGQATASPGSEAALNNLLNIIGVRDGAVSNISF